MDKTKSNLQVRISSGATVVTIPVGGIQGQTDGQTEAAFLDLEAGQPDAKGFTNINIKAASEYFFVDSSNVAGFVICIKPLVPVMDAGLIGCNGGADISLSLNTNHRLGEVGVDGFTAAECEAQQGRVEIPYAICSAGTVGLACTADADCDTSVGASDGTCTHIPARCGGGNGGTVCQSDDDCAAGVSCGMPHPGVCNGPLVPGFGMGDTGPGELFIVPNPDPNNPLNGMPIELGFEKALPCGDEGPGMRSPFALTTGVSSSMISNANNMPGHTLNFQAQGENFDCYNWQASAVGRLVLSAPALDQPLIGDVSTVFTFASHLGVGT